MLESTAHIGVLYVDIFIPASQSLKNKRAVLKKLQSQVRSKFNVSVSELDNHDKWQRATVGVCMICGDNRHINGALQKILTFIDQYHAIDVSDHRIEMF